ncbi:MAG: outer membrane beta-barrel protein [Legionella sp.]|nr:outer membrane beta-barrel protein [Legionella sp.]
MRKSILFTLLFSACCAQASENRFQGFELSLGAGGSTASFDVKQPLQVVIPDALHLVGDGTALADSNAVGLLGISYTYAFSPRFFLGLELSADSEGTQVTKTFRIQELMSGFDLGARTQVKLNNSFTLALQPGVLIDPNTLLYGLAGAQRGDFDISTIVTYDQSFGPDVSPFATIPLTTRSEHKTGLTLGAGVRRALSEHFTLGAEYRFADYGKVASPGALTAPVLLNGEAVGTMQVNVAKVAATINTLFVKLSYKV